MKRYLVLIFYSGCAFAFGQQPLLMPMVSSNSCGVKIINVSELNGDSVAVFFKADQKNAAGATIGIENMLVTEGGKKCGIISFQTIKKIAPIKLAVVIDYSSSTGGGRSFFHKFFANLDLLQEEEDTFTDIPFKKNVLNSPVRFLKSLDPDFLTGIHHAVCVLDFSKIATINFVHRFDVKRDSVCIVGIGEDIEVLYPLSCMQNYFEAVIARIHAFGGTPVFDGIELACTQMKFVNGTKAVVVVCDGGDIGSEIKKKQIINELSGKTLPVYIVDIGNKADGQLQAIAEKSGGKYYAENSLLPLDTISRLIKQKATYEIFYRLVYSRPFRVKEEFTPSETANTNGNVNNKISPGNKTAQPHINPSILREQKEVPAPKQSGTGDEQGK